MRMFDLAALTSWEPVEVGAGTPFPGQADRVQSLRFRLMASGPVEAYISGQDGERRLVAVGEGLMHVRCSVVGGGELLVFATDPEGELPDVFVYRRTEAQLRPESDQASFTTIEPRGVGPSDDLRRMMRMVQLNADRREALLRAELDRVRSLQAQPSPPSRAASAASVQTPAEPKKEGKPDEAKPA